MKPTRPGNKPINTQIPEPLFKRLRGTMRHHGVTWEQLATDALEHYLRYLEAEGVWVAPYGYEPPPRKKKITLDLEGGELTPEDRAALKEVADRIRARQKDPGTASKRRTGPHPVG